MADHELVKYIKDHLQLGYRFEDISAALIAAGHDKETINQAFHGIISHHFGAPKKKKRNHINVNPLITAISLLVLLTAVLISNKMIKSEEMVNFDEQLSPDNFFVRTMNKITTFFNKNNCGSNQKCFLDAMQDNCASKRVQYRVNGLIVRHEIKTQEQEKCVVDSRIVDIYWRKGLEKTKSNEKNYKKTREMLKGTEMICKLDTNEYADRIAIGVIDLADCEGSLVVMMNQHTMSMMTNVLESLGIDTEQNETIDWERKEPYKNVTLTAEEVGEGWSYRHFSGFAVLGRSIHYYRADKYLNPNSTSENDSEVYVYYIYYYNGDVAKKMYETQYNYAQGKKEKLNLGDESFTGLSYGDTILVIRKGLLVFEIKYPDLNFSTQIANKILAKLE